MKICLYSQFLIEGFKKLFNFFSLTGESFRNDFNVTILGISTSWFYNRIKNFLIELEIGYPFYMLILTQFVLSLNLQMETSSHILHFFVVQLLILSMIVLFNNISQIFTNAASVLI